MLDTLHTSRLLLRRWQHADRKPFADMNADPAVTQYLEALDHPASDVLVDAFDRHFDDHGFGPWAVEVKGVAPFIGFVGLWRTTFEAHFTPCVEIAWRLARDYWGQGYAAEAAREVCRVGFDELGLHEIVSFTAPDNFRSRRVMERLGMTHDPHDDFDHPRLPHGHALRRHVLYRLRGPRLADAEQVA